LDEKKVNRIQVPTVTNWELVPLRRRMSNPTKRKEKRTKLTKAKKRKDNHSKIENTEKKGQLEGHKHKHRNETELKKSI